MALVSPGISISVNDQSQYVNSNIGSVPLVVLATAQDKSYNGALATGTSKAKAGKLLSFSSQRDLVTQMGTPTFQVSASGTPVNGDETNEYGLMAAYSALGLTNQLFAIRADIDLAELKGTTVRPLGAPANETIWLDTVNTNWGINTWDPVTNAFTPVTPLIITESSQVYSDTSFAPSLASIPTPLSSVGKIGQYALVFVNTDGTTPRTIRLFYKKGPNSYTGSVASNSWIQVGSPDWQESFPTVVGTAVNPASFVVSTTYTCTINTKTVSFTASSTTALAQFATAINNTANLTGVKASVSSSGLLQIFVDSTAKSNGTVVDGKVSITDGTNTPIANAGIDLTKSTFYSAPTGTYFSPVLFYGSYAADPENSLGHSWSEYPAGSVWWKTSAIGGGFNPVVKVYNANLSQWQVQTVPMYQNFSSAIYGLDPAGGGINIEHGQMIASFNRDAGYNLLRFDEQLSAGTAVGTSGTPQGTVGSIGNTFGVSVSQPGTSTATSAVATLAGTDAAAFVSAILATGIPYISASVNPNGTISVTHQTGGQITLTNITSGLLANAGFALGQGSGFTTSNFGATINIGNFGAITTTILYQANDPYSPPAAGTLWYNSDAVDVDIMINDGGWKGYKNVSSDARGFNLTNTDPMGVIVTPTAAPTSQTDGTPLVPGDLWLDSGDLMNYPSLYRYNGKIWVAIDNMDHTSQNGIVFADARWDTDGTTDVISGDMPMITELLTSNYLDLDAPDYRLYPKGALLFNMRRSGYNVKKFVPNYFNETSFPNVGANDEGWPTAIPGVQDAWVTASGVDANDVMYAGSRAQRNMVVGAMQAALDSNLDAISPMYQFNILVAPNYPELIDNLLVLNENRGDTAFVIGDTPMDLAPNAVDIANWVNNTDGMTGYVIPSSPYAALYYPAGRTNDLAGNEIVVPASHAVLRTYLYSDQVSYPWFAPAGVQRGLVNNWSDIGYINSNGGFVHNAVNNGLRDALFTLKINPITQLPASGIAVWGQLTRSAVTSARDRVNVVRLENYLRTIFQSVANGYLFEPNDNITRKSIAAAISGSLNTILAHRGLYDFLVVCDSSNNTSATIANNQLYVDVAIEPERDVEFIYIPIAIYNPGQIAALG